MRLIMLFMITGLLLNTGVSFSQVANSVVKQPIEIYVRGKHYPSVEDYRLEKIADVLSETLSEEFIKNNPRFVEELIEELRSRDIEKLSSQEISEVIETYKSRYISAQTTRQRKEETDIASMQEMLEELKARNPKAQSVEIDPSQMKTIILPKNLKRTDSTIDIPQNTLK